MPASERYWRLLADPNLRVVFGVTLMAVLGVASVTPAFPQIAEALDVTPQSVGLLVAVFTLPGAVLTPVLGVLADRMGRKVVLVPSLLVFGIAGSACGFARSFELLVLLRLAQGFGAAALGALNVTVIGDLFTGARRTAAMGYNASVLSVGTAIYPAIGGGLAALAWYAPFFLPVLALPVGLVVLFVLEAPASRTRQRLRTYLVNAARLMRRREVLGLFTASVVTFVLIYGAYLSYFPFVLERGWGASPFEIGLVMSLTSVTTGVAAFELGRLARRFGERRLVLVGFVLYAVSFAAIPLVSSLWGLIALMLMFGAANGVNIPSILTILSGAAPEEYRAVVMSVNGTLIRVGQTLGPLVAGAAFVVAGLPGAFWVSAVIAGGMIVVLAGVGVAAPPRLARDIKETGGRA